MRENRQKAREPLAVNAKFLTVWDRQPGVGGTNGDEGSSVDVLD